MTLKLAGIEVQGFRGIPGVLTLDFRPERSNEPVSFILSGDNGTGKSSIVDALEFVLQGRIARQGISLRDAIPSVINCTGAQNCRVAATLTDGTTITRTIFKNYKGQWRIDRQPHPLFAISPFVLRRANILKFWNTPSNQRQSVFFAYLMDNQREEEIQADDLALEIDRLREERYRLKEERRDAAKDLATTLGIPIEDIPLDIKEFQQFAFEKVYDRKSSRQRKTLRAKGSSVQANPQADLLVRRIRHLSFQISSLGGSLGALQTPPAQKPDKSVLRDVLADASENVTKAFLRISPSKSFIDTIEIIQSTGSSIDLVIKTRLRNGVYSRPEEVFSEANLDLLALLIFLAFAKESAKRGQAKFLILDDVLQSVDASIRVLTTEYILEEFSDWQFIFTVHDRLWLEQLRELFRQRNVPFLDGEIVRWQFEVGPSIILGSRDIDLSLRLALAHGDIVSICSQSGLLLEKISHILSYSLPISVIRRKGDKYTLGDLWPGIFKVLSKTNCAIVVEDVNRWIHLRNLAGAHYNEWAQSLSGQEAQLFGEAVVRLLHEVRCDECYKWAERREGIGSSQPIWTCRCGKRKLSIDQMNKSNQ